MLSYLRGWYPHSSLSLKQLTLKTCMLVALSSSDRAQTIQSMRRDTCVFTGRGVEFPIFSRLKTSRHLRRPKVVVCPKSSDPAINVELCVTDYMARSWVLRMTAARQKKSKSSQLFVSHRSGLPVARNTISRWLTEVMSQAGIDTSYLFARPRVEVLLPTRLCCKVTGPGLALLKGTTTGRSWALLLGV